MNPIDQTDPSQTESISFEFDLHHLPEKVWRALTDPVLLMGGKLVDLLAKSSSARGSDGAADEPSVSVSVT